MPPVTIERWLEVQVAGDPPLVPRVQLIAAPYAIVASRLSGDLETQPGEFALKVVNKGIIKGNVVVNSANLVLGNEDNGGIEPSNQLTLEARKNKTYQKMTDSDVASRTAEISADSSGSSMVLEADDDADGLPDNGVEARLSTAEVVKKVTVRGWDQRVGQNSQFEIVAGDSGSSVILDCDDDGGGTERTLIGRTDRKSGSIILQDREHNEVVRSGFFNDSAGATAFADSDSDDDGKSERQFQTLSNASRASSRWMADIDDDGSPDYTATQTADALGARLAIKTKGTSAQRFALTAGANADSSVIENTFDEAGTGVARHRFLGAVTTQSANNRLSSDTDGNGLPENSVEQLTNDSLGSVTVVSRFGSGPRQTTSMDGSFEHSRVSCVSDLDADGLADNETEDFADATSARMRIVVQKHTLEPHEARMTADVAGPRIEISSASTVRASMSLNGVQVSDNSGTVVSEIGSDGNAYIAGNMKFGAVSGAHRIDVEGGAYCDGANWVNASDANSKENFASVDGREILNKLDRLDITRWNYKGQANAAHIGPTAQDFRKVFGVGSDDKSISTIDPSGIALAAIKELNRQNQELREQNARLQNELLDIKRAVSDLQRRR